ncbi:MAG: pyridoxal-phosphate dependent enzyme [Planctomycetota bacterium]
MNQPSVNKLQRIYRELASKVERARSVVYELDSATPLQRLVLQDGQTVYAKREDTSRVHSYKWRGSFFKMYEMVEQGSRGPFIAASAGNHAQGVAASAKKLGVKAIVFMPETTPALKQRSVAELGGRFVEIRLCGDGFDDAARAAEQFQQHCGGIMISPFDDVSIIAGQATVGLEMHEQHQGLTKIYVPIGGGGLASGVGFAIKVLCCQNCQMIGVEVEKQNSMQLSTATGQPVSMLDVDRFCDGTAVRRPGELTFELCRNLLDKVVTVTNREVCAAVRAAWESERFLPEPSGAIGLAAAIKFAGNDRNEVVGAVISGSNTDFNTLPVIVGRSQTDRTSRRYFRFVIDERNGSLIALLDEFLGGFNIVDFQYGKSSEQIATPVIGVEGAFGQLDELSRRMAMAGFAEQLNAGSTLLEYRVFSFHPELCRDAFFLKVEFPNRPGALLELMRRISSATNICYFNFTDSGETEGHALIGFECILPDSRLQIVSHLSALQFKFSNVQLNHADTSPVPK